MGQSAVPFDLEQYPPVPDASTPNLTQDATAIRADLRNVAIVAHVDHGKTTLVDAMLRQTGAFRSNQAVVDRVMDFGRPRAREGHHDPGQADDHRPRRGPAQHRRHPRPRRLRRGGGALAPDGRLGPPARRRGRGSAAPDPLRAPEGDGPPPAGRGRDQQDRSRRCAGGGGPRRHLRAVHGSRRGRPPDRVPGRLHQRQGGHGDARPGRARHRPRPAPRPPHRGHAAGHLHARSPAPAARHQPVRQRLRRPDGGRADLERADPDRPADRRRPRGGGRHGRHDRARPHDHPERDGDQPPDGPRHRPGRHRGGRPGRHRQRRRPARGDDRRHADRAGRPAPAAAPGRRRPDPAHDVRRQHLAAGRSRGQVRHQPSDQGPPREGGPRQRLDRGPAGRIQRGLRGPRPGRAPAGRAHRADAARGLRADRVAPRGAPARGRRRDPGAVRADHHRHPARLHRGDPDRPRRVARAVSSRSRPTPTAASGWSTCCRSAASSAIAASC